MSTGVRAVVSYIPSGVVCEVVTAHDGWWTRRVLRGREREEGEAVAREREGGMSARMRTSQKAVAITSIISLAIFSFS